MNFHFNFTTDKQPSHVNKSFRSTYYVHTSSDQIRWIILDREPKRVIHSFFNILPIFNIDSEHKTKEDLSNTEINLQSQIYSLITTFFPFLSISVY